MSRHRHVALGRAGEKPQAGGETREAAAKVIVVGPGEAGKSTLIARLVSGAVNLAVVGRTVAMDHGMLRRVGAKLSLVGVPGQRRFAAVREALAVSAVGAVWVHPAGEEIDAETVALLAASKGNPLPYLVYVNHRTAEWPLADFPAPATLGPPQAVMVGNLMESDLDDLVESVWALAFLAAAGGSGGERR